MVHYISLTQIEDAKTAKLSKQIKKKEKEKRTKQVIHASEHA
jgi:hypothetical protein